MAKQKKKRDKSYKGSNAAMARPSVTRISAVHRNPVNQWWFDHKRVAKPVLIAVAVVAVIVICVIQLVQLATGA
ncbi:hypothetical protein EON76_00125 [bacterium]|nr:MAG: hypothetical protein EON76_00125 [bacterium]